MAADRLQELYVLLDRLEQLVAPDRACTCTFNDKLFEPCLPDDKNSTQSVSSISDALAQVCQCGPKAAKSKSVEYAVSTAQVKEVVE